MRRRYFIGTGLVVGAGTLAGCSGILDQVPETGDDTTDGTDTDENGDTTDGTDDTGDTDQTGDRSYSVSPSATEMEWGEDYTVDVTVEAGSESGRFYTAIVYSGEDDTSWTDTIEENMWSLDAGETTTETFEIEPPDVGDLSFGVMTQDEEVVAEWDLTVARPQFRFGETMSYYSGLDVTVDAQFLDTITVTVNDMWGDEIGEYTVRPEDGKWVEVTVTVENTNIENEVRSPDYSDFNALAGGTQLDKPRNPTVYHEFTEYEVLEDESFSEGDGFSLPDEDGYYDPPSTMIGQSTAEGWIMFTTDTDTTLDELSIRYKPEDIRVSEQILTTWETA